MKKVLLAMTCIILVLLFTGCCLSHEWEAATCSTPKTCSKCGKTEGETLPHTWGEATCTTPKTCSVCNTTEGNTLAHTWIDADCTHEKTCLVCNTTEGEPLGHLWIEATCSTPKTCSVCGMADGEPIEHSWEWTVTREPVYGNEGMRTGCCSVCGETIEEEIPALVPEFTWNESITLEMPLETVEVGIYKDDEEYWIEFRCESMNTERFLTFFVNSTSDWGFTVRDVASRMSKVMQMYDSIKEKGTMAYAVMEGYGIKWTVYLEMDNSKPATVGLKVNKLNEFTAVFDGVIKE